MSKKQWLIIIGIIIMALPFLGFPSNWDSFISVILGLVIILISYSNNINRARKNSRLPVAPYVDAHSNNTPDITSDSNFKI